MNEDDDNDDNVRKLKDPKVCLKGRNKPEFEVPEYHKAKHLKKNRTIPPFPNNLKMAIFGMGCFWGAEKLFYSTNGVYSTNVGYSGGVTPNPNYKEVCSGLTNHAEVVRVIYDEKQISYWDLLNIFWSGHDSTTLCQQGNDIGTQYRSCIYYYDDEQGKDALLSKQIYQKYLKKPITTEIVPIKVFYYAEGYHQQSESDYCGLQPQDYNLPDKNKINQDSNEQKD